MPEIGNKMLLAGLGALSLTRKRAEEIFDELVRQGRVTRRHRAGFIKNALAAAGKTRRDLEDLVARQVRQATAKLNLPSRGDLARVEKKLDRLLKQKRRAR